MVPEIIYDDTDVDIYPPIIDLECRDGRRLAKYDISRELVNFCQPDHPNASPDDEGSGSITSPASTLAPLCPCKTVAVLRCRTCPILQAWTVAILTDLIFLLRLGRTASFDDQLLGPLSAEIPTPLGSSTDASVHVARGDARSKIWQLKTLSWL
ncbi:hypothetical protein K469DRAFT_790695 [Zopfia rhizophila CBS 207.26]|uniref:Uncharacterized protein n=1 Tax=Zopfia rhizophila CBS 207.26 TaxID=1314779 RepID=A0A6A6DUY3_9PEZI|nr:hypothetical protein K469DRAFT_790695 [Zopfia rhizophila CBS 207.26]